MYVLPFVASLFTSDGDVVYRVTTLSTIAAIFQVHLRPCRPSQGVLKAMGRQSEVAGFTFMSLYILGLPLAYFWGMYVRPTYGLLGFWIGLTVGMGTLALILVVLVYIADWHRECRRANFRLHRERQGFQAVATGDNNPSANPTGAWPGPQVGRPMLGESCWWVWFRVHKSSEEMDEVNKLTSL